MDILRCPPVVRLSLWTFTAVRLLGFGGAGVFAAAARTEGTLEWDRNCALTTAALFIWQPMNFPPMFSLISPKRLRRTCEKGSPSRQDYAAATNSRQPREASTNN